MSIINDENRYKILKLLAANPDTSQRQIAQTLGISLGKVNYCLKALMAKGWIKAGNFKRNPDKKAFTYLLTLKGVEEKANVTLRFLERKQSEHEALMQELKELRNEVVELGLSEKISQGKV